MKAVLIYRKTDIRSDGIKLEMVIWQLPAPTPDRPHGLKYRLWAGRDGKTLVRYDNEAGKGDHKHVGRVEKPYAWRGMGALVEDFLNDVEALK
jgi:hypothetical protein